MKQILISLSLVLFLGACGEFPSETSSIIEESQDPIIIQENPSEEQGQEDPANDPNTADSPEPTIHTRVQAEPQDDQAEVESEEPADEEAEDESENETEESNDSEENEEAGAEEEAEEEAVVRRARVFGESGQIIVDHEEVRLDFARRYQNPVVFALGVSQNGGDPVRVQLKDVDNQGATIWLQESPAKDGWHVEETVSYMVFEAGRWELESGHIIEVGHAVAHANVGKKIKKADRGFQRVNFAEEFASHQVSVFAQLQSNDREAFASVRMRNLSAKHFDFAIEKEESATEGYGRGSVGYLAVEAHSDETFGVAYGFGITAREVRHKSFEVVFDWEFAEAPVFMSQLASYYGGDSAQMRSILVDRWGADFFVEEDQSLDSEMKHTQERVSFMYFEVSNRLKAYPADQ